MGTSADRPYIDAIYKLCETQAENGDFSPIMKLSEGKITLPGRKQVYRLKDQQGNYSTDVISLADEKLDGETLLIKVMEDGKMTYELPSLDEVRSKAKASLTKLPEKYKKLISPPRYPVELSGNLNELTNGLAKRLMEKEKRDVIGKA
jgi:nicotinate phosphoribosyltransferase